MKLAVCAVVGFMLVAGPAVASDPVTELKTEKQKLSYALGLDLGSYFKSLETDFNLSAVSQGITDSYTGGKALLTPDEAEKIQKQFAIDQQKKKVEQIKALMESNKDAAAEFLEKNKKAEGVKVTASGLQYKVMTEGKGDKPSATDTVKVHYKGTLLDGSEFDSSYKRNEPASFRVDQVIPGWTEALQLMTPGSKYMLYLSPELAYGDRGMPPAIEPGSLLIFEVELVEIIKGEDK
ncbi:MAG: FKBP-type peptidyl-prolyl cis-trans isomerase [Candidatus Electrothrix aestuarii]|jgi:FKBP-type peptidyl-prolyl cis-trans isomerase|uniref:Peptidyl-prolyl cis-trans isomerase n=1 Tax=Candidatus Electrothrix aestuarii TaxID=3062594 RepID=A0AAU8LRE2_9BACT|nr:FKBP-type peptidyl-prolyl cis-trans isomerase [Candidatus Electrothrix aestuarii]WPD21874.1 MAG: FKBP-type peptidyl-prolyl cis-trans isomerase [Candidatus Electrothrix sp. GW3-3]